MKRESRLRGLEPHAEASVAIYTPALEPAILWARALDSRTDIFGCRILDPGGYGASVQLTGQTDFNRQVFALQFHPVQVNCWLERLEYLLIG